MKKYVDFTQGNIVRAIILFYIPLIKGVLLQNLYNSLYALAVANLSDQHALAAVTVCGMIANMVINFFMAAFNISRKQILLVAVCTVISLERKTCRFLIRLV